MARLRRVRLKIPVGGIERLPDSAQIRPGIFCSRDLRRGGLRSRRDGTKSERDRRGSDPDDRGDDDVPKSSEGQASIFAKITLDRLLGEGSSDHCRSSD